MSTTSPPGGRSRQRERDPARLRALIVLGVLVLLAAGVVAWSLGHQAFSSGSKAADPPTSTACPTATASTVLVPNRGVRVNVLNSTDRSGLAAGVRTQLAARGFVVAAVGNAQDTYSGTAEVRYGAPGLRFARTLAVQIPGAKLVRIDRSTQVVDLVLGTGYTKLATAAQIAAASKAMRASPSC